MEGISFSVESHRELTWIEWGYGKVYLQMEGAGLYEDARNICDGRNTYLGEQEHMLMERAGVYVDGRNINRWKEYLSEETVIDAGLL